MPSTAILDYRIHQMQLGSPRSPLNCQVLSLHLPHPGLQPRTPTHLPNSMSAPSRPHGSQYYQKTTNGPPYLTSPPPLQRSPPTHQSRTAVPTPYDGPIDLSRSSKPAVRLSTGPVAQHDEGSEDLSLIQESSTNMHLGMGSPGIARRAKAHVPSACVNCKRKHLACETRRPCNRCLQAGKEVRHHEPVTLSNAYCC